MRGLEGLRGGNARPTAGGRAETKARLGEGRPVGRRPPGRHRGGHRSEPACRGEIKKFA